MSRKVSMDVEAVVKIAVKVKIPMTFVAEDGVNLDKAVKLVLKGKTHPDAYLWTPSIIPTTTPTSRTGCKRLSKRKWREARRSSSAPRSGTVVDRRSKRLRPSPGRTGRRVEPSIKVIGPLYPETSRAAHRNRTGERRDRREKAVVQVGPGGCHAGCIRGARASGADTVATGSVPCPLLLPDEY